MSEPRVLVIIPTYNEKENLPRIVDQVRVHAPNVDILVADDNSPDGTGAIADDLAKAHSHVHVLHRRGKQGLGAAYLAGFDWGLAQGYDLLIEMDADGSHPASVLPELIAQITEHGADVAIGSRWVPGGRVVNWPKHREILSRGGNTYTRLMLGMPVKDATAGFRAFTADALRRMNLAQVKSQGYCFQVDMTWRATQQGMTIREVPITFTERELGTSKMSQSIVAEALWMVTRWGIRYRVLSLYRMGRRAKDADSRQ